MCALVLGLLEEHENSRQVIESLTLSGHQVHVVSSFAEAMYLFENSNKIALIISDVHLENGGNVFDFLRWIKKNPVTKDIPFVLFSSEPTGMAKHLEDGLRTSARMLGASMYITMNTFDSKEFREKIDSLLPPAEANQMQKTNIQAKKEQN